MDIKKKYELQVKKNDDLQKQIYELQLENDQLRADADRQIKIMEELNKNTQNFTSSQENEEVQFSISDILSIFVQHK